MHSLAGERRLGVVRGPPRCDHFISLARFKKEYEGLTKIAPPFNLFIYMY